MNVLITGATGFVGSHLARLFARHHRVTVLARPGSDQRFLPRARPSGASTAGPGREVAAAAPERPADGRGAIETGSHHLGVRVVPGDLEDPASLARALQGQDLLIHAAAKVSDWGAYPEFHRANVEGSLALLDALPVGARMIHLSSTAVLGEEDCPAPKGVSAPYRPRYEYAFERTLPSAMNHYRISKALAEQLLIKRARGKGIALTVIRPVWIYGPREFHAGPFEYCQAARDGLPAMSGSPAARFHVVYVEDLARMVLKVAEAQPTGVKVYNLGNPEVPTIANYWRAWGRGLGCAEPRYVPQALLYPLALVLEAAWTLLGVRTPPLFTRARVNMFFDNNIYDVADIVRDFGPFTFTPLERGVAKTIRWWRQHRFL